MLYNACGKRFRTGNIFIFRIRADIRVFVPFLCLAFFFITRKKFTPQAMNKFREVNGDLRRAWTRNVSQSTQTPADSVLFVARYTVRGTIRYGSSINSSSVQRGATGRTGRCFARLP